MKTRIVERTDLEGNITYVIQQKHFLFRWWWVDAWMNSSDAMIRDYFSSLEEAVINLKYFDGTECPDDLVVYP